MHPDVRAQRLHHEQREAHKLRVLEAALERADRAMALVDKMHSDNLRQKHRAKIERTIEERKRTRSRVGFAVLGSFYLNLAVLAFFFFNGAGLHIASVGDAFMVSARIAGLTGTYLLLVQLLLVGRVKVLDSLYGMDRLTRWHKRNGHLSFDLIVMHAVAAVVGRTLLSHVSVFNMIDQVLHYRFMVPAVLGLFMMAGAIATSIRRTKRKITHGKWHFFHLWTYLGVALSFGHELFGPDFAHQPVAQDYIWFLYGATFAILGYCRIVLPISNTLIHQMRVAKVIEEGPGVTSIYMTGFRLERLRAKPGQFCWWRFLSGRDWRESHPFSLSTAPNSKYLRITVKSLGDFSSRIGEMPVGTWVTFEGPFGGFTADSRTGVKTVLLAGGVGITPIRSLLEGLPSAHGDITVIYRADKVEDAVLLHELEGLASARRAKLHLVLGTRESWPADCQPLSQAHLQRLVPDIKRQDVYICASPGMTAGVRGTLRSMGLPGKQVHHETFD